MSKRVPHEEGSSLKTLFLMSIDSLLCSACQHGALSDVQDLLARGGVDVNACGAENLPPLALAARAGHVEIVRLLLHSCSDANVLLALTSAAERRDNVAVLQLLVDSGVKRHNLSAAIKQAGLVDCERNFRCLWAAGASHAAAFQAAVSGRFAEPLESLARWHVDVDTRVDEGTALIATAMFPSDEQCVSLCRSLLVRGADPNATFADLAARSALHVAVSSIPSRRGPQQYWPLCCRWLLAGGADANAADEDGETPLMQALGSSSRSALLPLLLAAGASFAAVNKSGESALQMGWDNVDGWLFKEALTDALSDRYAFSDEELADARSAVAVARAEIEQSRRELLADRRALVRSVAWPIAVGLQGLHLPAFVTLCVLDESLCLLSDLATMHFKWSVICAVKHFHDRGEAT
jgi:ankyrin repeat protein